MPTIITTYLFTNKLFYYFYVSWGKGICILQFDRAAIFKGRKQISELTGRYIINDATQSLMSMEIV